MALACCDNPTGISTHLAYLKLESYNLQSKNLVHKDVDFYVQNAPKLTYENAHFQKNFERLIYATLFVK